MSFCNDTDDCEGALQKVPKQQLQAYKYLSHLLYTKGKKNKQ